MKKITLIVLLAASVGLMQACNGGKSGDKGSLEDTAASDPTHDSLDNSGQVTQETDVEGDSKTFMDKVAVAGMTEIELGKYAQENGKSSRVKNFGAMMVADHTKAANELGALAKNKEVQLPTTVDAEHKSHIDMLEKMKGADFDKQYIEMMVKGHQDVVDLLNKGTQNRDADVKAFAAKTLPVVQTHLDSAKAISGSLK
ncbi:DUF4142 domain-containing protein [Pedobacter sp. HMF7647]|uniref:DUF4142 domain-containing protein n=1 Tax=Hufsiella arboris TaxID=2695275 RepID=A0A7K1YCQ2_9SPHI|nr:DUF4142 domain-containing protein [Hufsiella arboris]MXV52161.1 DUF4142 domain-containing protein [Hufsiella arboris]